MAKYRVVRRPVYRGAVQAGERQLIRFDVGAVMEPTADELRRYPQRFQKIEGGEQLEASTGRVVTDGVQEAKEEPNTMPADSLLAAARLDLQNTNVNRLRAIIREADPGYLNALEMVERERKDPRQRIIADIDRRRKALLSEKKEQEVGA